MSKTRVLILGGGYVGLYTALTLQKKARGKVDITLIDRRPYMTYAPFLPEAGAGSIEARHAVVPLRRTLKGVRVLQGKVTNISHQDRRVTAETDLGENLNLEFDELVVALGAVSRTFPTPGLAENAIGFKFVEEAAAVRNRILNRIARAATTSNPELRKRLLSFVFVGGGFAGIEAFSETEDMAKAALRYYPELSPEDLNFVMVEAANHILPEMGPDMGEYTKKELESRGMRVLLSTTLDSCVDGHVELSNGERFDADTIVWTAGVKPAPVMSSSDLPLGPRGHMSSSPTLQVVDQDGRVVDGVWAAGDCAQVPNLVEDEGDWCAPSAQHAVRQARHMGANIAAKLSGGELKEYKHKHLGMVASLGLNKGVAVIMGVKMRGWPAWVMHRTYHLSQIPTVNRKLRVTLDWTIALLFRRDMVSLSRVEVPRRAFEEAARG